MALIKPWLCQKHNWLLVLSACCLGLSAPGYGLWPLAWVGLIPAIWVLSQTQSARLALGQGFMLGSLYHAIVFGWFLGLHPLTWMGVSPLLSIMITLLGWLTCASSQGCLIACIWLLGYCLLKQMPKLFWFLFPVCWVLGLWGLNFNPIGLPWGFLIYSQANVPLIRHLVYTFSFWGAEAWLILVNIALFYILKRDWCSGLLGVSLCLALFVWGQGQPPPQHTAVWHQYHPIVLQGNIPIEADRLLLTTTDKAVYYQTLIQQGLATNNLAKLIVLPEGVAQMDTLGILGQGLPTQSTLLTGGLFKSAAGWHNGAILKQTKRTQTMAKRILVPFGETTPFIPERLMITVLKQFGIDYAPGFAPSGDSKPSLFQISSLRIGPLICFEALYPHLAWQYKSQHANLLVTLSNLGWYHLNPLLEKQFLAINQIRAAESGLPLVLATNTGVSALISPTGAVLKKSQSGQVSMLTLSEDTR